MTVCLLYLQEMPPEGDAPLPAEGPPHPPPFSQAEFLDSLQVATRACPLQQGFLQLVCCMA